MEAQAPGPKVWGLGPGDLCKPNRADQDVCNSLDLPPLVKHAGPKGPGQGPPGPLGPGARAPVPAQAPAPKFTLTACMKPAAGPMQAVSEFGVFLLGEGVGDD